MSTHRFDGCTLTGALSITTQVTDGVTIVHGPAGCAHHNFSLLHATLQESGEAAIPHLVSSRLNEENIIFGGEDALERTIRSAISTGVQSIFVVSTCIADTIGDDVGAVCAADWDVPVIYIPTSGFFGGAFHHGLLQALRSISRISDPAAERDEKRVTLIGEKNLEYEVEENYQEMERLLSLIGLTVGIRYVRNQKTSSLVGLGEGRLNVLREPDLANIGRDLEERFQIPFLPSFPVGLKDTLKFLEGVGEICHVDCRIPVEKERALQDEMLEDFSDLKGEAVSIVRQSPLVEMEPACISLVEEVVPRLGMRLDIQGVALPLPVSAPVGTAGVRRLLHRWRRIIHA